MSEYDTYLHAMIWTCTSCGFSYFGGQPKMECPACGAYKTAFIDIPQHIEQKVREELGENPPNHKENRARRLELMEEHDVRANNRAAGRVLPAASGNHMNPSTLD